LEDPELVSVAKKKGGSMEINKQKKEVGKE
jgi:hypothetical protein